MSRSEKIRKTAAAVVCCGLCVSTGLLGSIAVRKMPEINGKTAFADGFVYVQDNNNTVEFSRVDESFFAPGSFSSDFDKSKAKYPDDYPDGYSGYNQEAKFSYMPGDEKSGSITIANKADPDKVDTVAISLYASSTGVMRNTYDDDGVPQEFVDFYNQNKSLGYTAAQLKEKSDALVQQLELEIKRGDDVVYSGPLTGDGSSSKMTKISPISIGELKAGESAKYTFTLKVPSTLGNDYANSVALIDWVFVISSWKPKQPPSSSEPVSSEPVPSEPVPSETVSSEPVSSEPAPATTTTTKAPPAPPSPGTGEAAFPYTMGAVFCGLSALVIFFIAFGNIDKKAKDLLEDE